LKKFKYTAMNLERKQFTGVFLAEDEQQLALLLAEQSLYLIKAKPVTRTSASTFFTTSGKVGISELATLCRQFAIMVTTGIPVIDSLEILKSQDYSPLLRKTLEFVHESVKSGALLSEALEKHKKIFPRFFLSMIKVGEISGGLDKILVTLADYFETDASIRKKTKKALIYPISLIIMAFAIIILMVVFVIPTFMDALSAMEVTMPAITLALFNISEWFKAKWKELFLIVLGVILFIWLLLKTKQGKLYFDKLKATAPIIGKITTDLITARFARALGILIDGGLDIIDAMDAVKIVLGNKYIEKKFSEATEDVRQGMSLTVALNSYKIFPPLIIQMISVGEKTGSLSEVLLRSCAFFDEQAESALTSVTGIIQPIILGLIGGAVGILFYAIYSPLLQIMQQIGV